LKICGIRVRRGGHIVLPVAFFTGAKDEEKHIVIDTLLKYSGTWEQK